MYCKIKFDLEQDPFIFNFTRQNEIPEDIVYLYIYSPAFDEDYKGDKEFDFTRFKDLIELNISLKLVNINLLENRKLEKLYIESYNLSELKVYKNSIKYLTLYDCIIIDINILKEYVNLEYLNLGLSSIINNKIIFPKINIERLIIDEFRNDIKELDLNNLYNLKYLTIYNTLELKELYIDKLMNLKELYVSGLVRLEILKFDKIKLSLLDCGEYMTSLKYIDGYFENFNIHSNEEAKVYNRKIISRRRVYLFCEYKKGPCEYKKEPCEGPCEVSVADSIICGKCAKYVSKYNKINIRDSKIKYYEIDDDDNEIEHSIKLLSCC